MPKSKIIMSHQAHTGKVEAVIVPETINIIQGTMSYKAIPCACACTRKACNVEKLALLVIFVTILLLVALLHLHIIAVTMSMGAYIWAVLFTAGAVIYTVEAVKAIDNY